MIHNFSTSACLLLDCLLWVSFSFAPAFPPNHFVEVLLVRHVIILQESLEGQKMMEFRKSLPAFKEREALLKAISQNQVCSQVK